MNDIENEISEITAKVNAIKQQISEVEGMLGDIKLCKTPVSGQILLMTAKKYMSRIGSSDSK